jgi:hypothetical protein
VHNLCSISFKPLPPPLLQPSSLPNNQAIKSCITNMTDPRLQKDGHVHAPSDKVTDNARTLFGPNYKSTFINGTVVSVLKEKAPNAKRATTKVEIDFELQGSEKKRKILTFQSVKKGWQPQASCPLNPIQPPSLPPIADAGGGDLSALPQDSSTNPPPAADQPAQPAAAIAIADQQPQQSGRSICSSSIHGLSAGTNKIWHGHSWPAQTQLRGCGGCKLLTDLR